jgi:type I restriction enzyme, S subunit
MGIILLLERSFTKLNRLRHFIHKCIISPYFQDEIMRVQVGVSREDLSMSKLANFIVPIPPINEQKRIIMKLEKLTMRIRQLDNSISNQERLQKKLIKAYLNIFD